MACSGGAKEDDFAVVGEVQRCPAVRVVRVVGVTGSVALIAYVGEARFGRTQVECCEGRALVLAEVVE